jgi:hypothetical protein
MALHAREGGAREKVRQFITERLGEFLDAMADNCRRHSSSLDERSEDR